MNRYLFAYGTLMKGFGLNGYLGTSQFLGKGTITGMKMYISGCPICVPSNNEKDVVHGEVYEISDENASRIIDNIELGAGYQILNKLVTLENEEKILCEMYVMGRGHGMILESGDFRKVYR